MKKTKAYFFMVTIALAMMLMGCGAGRQTEHEHIEATADDVAESQEVVDIPEETNAADVTESADVIEPIEPTDAEIIEEESESMKMQVEVNGSIFTATLEENVAVDALVEMMKEEPVTIQLSDYSGFEKVGSLGTSLPTDNKQTTTYAGDIVLYQGNQIVMFYGSNSWSYTRIGHIDDLTGWEDALGSGDVTATFSLQ